MKIAYYEENDYHTEIMGTFLQFFSTLNTEITVYNSRDKSSIVGYFNKYCKFSMRPHICILNEYQLFTKIIIGSSGNVNDFVNKLTEIDYNNFIFICHHPSEIKKEYKNVIVLTPLNYNLRLNPNIKYILPIHNYILNFIPNKDNILTIIGRFKDSNRDTNDLINLIVKYHNSNFVVHLFSRIRKFVPNKLLILSKTYPRNLKITFRRNSEQMEEHLKNSKYILPLVGKNSWYHKDRLSGNIALAYNYNIPLIIDEKLRNIYQIENCVTYKNSLSEIIGTVINMPEEQYQQMTLKFMEEKKEILRNNTTTLQNII